MTAEISIEVSEQSLRRAFDSGRTANEILAFLEGRATRGVPQPLAYLVNDMGRRFVVVESDGVQQRVDVVLGIAGNGRVEIVEGLSEGQVVVAP